MADNRYGDDRRGFGGGDRPSGYGFGRENDERRRMDEERERDQRNRRDERDYYSTRGPELGERQHREQAPTDYNRGDSMSMRERYEDDQRDYRRPRPGHLEDAGRLFTDHDRTAYRGTAGYGAEYPTGAAGAWLAHGGRAASYGAGYHEMGYGADFGEDRYRSDFEYSDRSNEEGFFAAIRDEFRHWFGGERSEGASDTGRRARWFSFRGRGPKGYRRSDERIRDDINDRLTDDHMLDAEHIEVTVRDGEVMLDGMVRTRACKRRAEDIAESVSGVGHVQNNLRIRDRTSGTTGPGGPAGPAR